MDRLATKEGLHLLRHYVHFTCTPTRSSFQSGRLPVHVQTTLTNPDQPNAGIPRNMTSIAAKMQSGGYQTHIVGKWDCGMATFDHTPRGRGYNTSLIYFEHKNDYWTQLQMQSDCLETAPDIIDLWKDGKPAYGLNGSMYEEYLFANTVYDLIEHFPETVDDQPFFLVYTPHIAHCPLQVPKEVLNRYNFSDDENACQAQTAYIYPGYDDGDKFKCRSTYHAMISVLDEIVGNITDLLKANDLWDNTLLVLSSDNGGPMDLRESGSNNTPLRGSKYTPWEGGIRVAAFVSGGYLPVSRRGQKEHGMVHIADWYTTFSQMVGVDPIDKRAKKYGLPPVDGVNIWPLVSGQNVTSPRTQIAVFDNALIDGNYKYLIGNIGFASWGGDKYPNASSVQDPVEAVHMDCENGCLFNVVQDTTEHFNIAQDHPDIMSKMANELQRLKQSFYTNNETGEDSCPDNIGMECACWMAMHYWNGFFGPYQYLGNVTHSNVDK
eukprot:62666_1